MHTPRTRVIAQPGHIIRWGMTGMALLMLAWWSLRPLELTDIDPWPANDESTAVASDDVDVAHMDLAPFSRALWDGPADEESLRSIEAQPPPPETPRPAPLALVLLGISAGDAGGNRRTISDLHRVAILFDVDGDRVIRASAGESFQTPRGSCRVVDVLTDGVSVEDDSGQRTLSLDGSTGSGGAAS